MVKKSTPLRLSLVIMTILITAHRLPAPILEENPTPAPEKSAKPKAPRASKPKPSASVASLRATAAPTLGQNRFDGTWVGTMNNHPFAGNVEFTLVLSGGGTAVTEKSVNFGTKNFRATCDGSTMRWTGGANSAWSLIPNGDGKTALVVDTCAGFFGVGAYNGTAVFRKTFP